MDAETQAALDDLNARVKRLEGAAPDGTGDWGSEFREKWRPLTDAEFFGRYNTTPGGKIPPMAAYDEGEVIYRARAAYATYGLPGPMRTKLAEAYESIKVISLQTAASAKDCWEVGYGTCDPDVAAYGFYMGLFTRGGVSPYHYREFASTPEWSALRQMLAPNFGGGGPSGG